MTDRELLEYAAKAAGIGWDLYEGEWYGGGVSPNWNPLTDDGDALRLAVKLEIQLDLRHSMNTVRAYGAPQGMLEEGAKDPLAATRRAITRAAAEVGRKL